MSGASRSRCAIIDRPAQSHPDKAIYASHCDTERPLRAIATFGGTAQLIVTWLIHATGNALAPAWYMMFATAVGLVAMTMMRETAPARLSAKGIDNR